MSTITTRSGKGSPLTNNEVDANFTNLNNDKLESADLSGYAELTGATFTGEVEATGFNGDLTGAILFKGQAGEALTKGDPVYISGISGNKTVVSKADANDSSKMPCFGIVDATVSANADCSVVTFGTLQGLDTSSFSEGDELFVSDTGALTTTAPTGESSQIQKIGKVTRSHASAGSIKVMGAGRTNATPNLNDGQFFLGNGSNQAVSADFATSVLGEISAGTGIGISASGVISNTDPDQTVVLTGSGATSISGTYPNFTISSTDNNTTYSAGTGVTLAGTTFSLTDTNAKLNLTGGTLTGALSGTTATFSGNLNIESDIRVGTAAGAINQTGIIKENGSAYGLGFFTWGDTAPVQIGGGSVNLQKEAGGGVDLKINGTTVIDSSRNLTNINAITSTGVAALTRGNGSVGAPNTANHDTGTRIELYNTSATSWYAIGIESNTMWFNSDSHYRFYTDAVSKVDFDGNGVVNAVGGYKVNGTTVIDSSRNLTNISNAYITNGGALHNYTSSGSLRGYIGAVETGGGTAAGLVIATSGGETISFKDGGLSGTLNAEINGSGDLNLITGTLDINGTTVIDSSRQIFAKTGTQVGEDGTYAGYGVIGFGGITNGYNRVFGRDDSGDGLFLAAATGRGVYVRTNGSSSDTFSFTAAGAFQVGGTTVIDASRNATFNSVTISTGNLNIRTQNEENPTDVIYLGANNGNSSGTSNDIGTGLVFAPQYSGYSKRSAGIMQIGEGNYFRSGLAFYTNNTSNATTDWSERMRLTMDGNLNLVSGSFTMGGTTVIDASRNINAQNINNTNGAKLEIQSQVDGGTSRGIFMWDITDPNWGIYMATAGAGKSLSGDSACASLDGRTAHHVRFRTYGADATRGWIFENNLEAAKVSITSDTGKIYSTGDHYVGSNVVWNAGNDGSGSGLDADLLDGQHASAFATLSGSNSFSNSYNEFGNSTGSVSNDGSWNARVNIAGSQHARLDVKSVSDGIITSMYSHTGHAAGKVGTYSNHPLHLMINGTGKAVLSTTGSLSTTPQGTLWGASNDGSGSGLDADLLDGQQGSYYAPASHVHSYLPLSGGTVTGQITVSGTSPQIKFNDSDHGDCWIHVNSNRFYVLPDRDSSGGWETPYALELNWSNNTAQTFGNTIWTAGNDGSGSGLDADLLDGQHASAFLGVNATAAEASSLDVPDTRNSGARAPNDYADHKVTAEFTDDINGAWWSSLTVKGWHDGYAPWQLVGYSSTAQSEDFYVRFGHGSNNTWTGLRKIWHSGNDGSGSGLDADLLDGQQGSSYLRSNADDTCTGMLTLQRSGNTSYSTPNIFSKATSSSGGVANYHARFNRPDGTSNGHISTNYYATTYATTSDYRVKEDLQPMLNATSRLMALNPINFQWKDSDIRTDGFLAHEVAEVVSDAVVGEKDAVDENGSDQLQALDQAKLVPLLVKTIQEQQAAIEALEARIANLES